MSGLELTVFAGLGGMISGLFSLLITLGIPLLVIAGFWKAFEKAGEPGWAALVPIYNLYVFLKIAGRPAWWIVLFFIPVVGLVVAVIAAIDFAKAYGKDVPFGVGVALLGPIFVPMLGFGDARYVGATA